ncbi:MAG TPA: hypothetical protein DD646_00835, partial [Acidimicrobiaceae bacterium]|nr:hypothetical protein [Acidimicrobiaceae bacterium]
AHGREIPVSINAWEVREGSLGSWDAYVECGEAVSRILRCIVAFCSALRTWLRAEHTIYT